MTDFTQMPAASRAVSPALDLPRLSLLPATDRWLTVLLVTLLLGPIGPVTFAGGRMTVFWSDPLRRSGHNVPVSPLLPLGK